MAEVRFYPTSLDRSTISDEDLFDVQIMKAGGDQFKSAKMRSDELKASINPYKFFGRTLEENEVRTLNSINGGLGIKLLPLTDNTTYDIVNVVMIFDIGNVGFDVDAIFWLHFGNSEPPIDTITVKTSAPTNEMFARQADVVNGERTILVHNFPVYIWLPNLFTDFQGKVRIEFEYRELSLVL